MIKLHDCTLQSFHAYMYVCVHVLVHTCTNTQSQIKLVCIYVHINHISKPVRVQQYRLIYYNTIINTYDST